MNPPPITSAAEAASAAARTALRVAQRAVGVHAVERLAGRAERSRERAGCEHEPVVGERVAVGEPDRLLAGAHGRDLAAEPEVDLELGVGLRGLDEDRILVQLAAQEALRERRPVVRRVRVGRQDRDGSLTAGVPECPGDAGGGQAAADDHDAILSSHVRSLPDAGAFYAASQGLPPRPQRCGS